MKIMILGSGQDDGIPHTGCCCSVCKKAKKSAEHRRLGPSAALIDKKKGFCYMIDASPDFKYQLDMVCKEVSVTKREGKIPLSGILLTHAHLGHCAGLWHLGMESVEERELPVFCTSKMERILQKNYPFSLLVERRNIIIKEIYPNKKLILDGLKLRPIQVPHRNEVGDTLGYILESTKKIIYLPDIDRWTDNVTEQIRSSDAAFVDGTFYSKSETSRFKQIPHPPINETIDLLRDVDTEVYFTHINHTNPINMKGVERRNVESKGFRIAYDGLTLEI